MKKRGNEDLTTLQFMLKWLHEALDAGDLARLEEYYQSERGIGLSFAVEVYILADCWGLK